jgi:uncharacterized protein YndB with AHSA1/START domain
MRKTIRVSIDLPAEAETVYQALTDESQVKRWLAEHAEISLPRGVYSIWGRFLPGAPKTPVTSLVKASPNRSLHLVWRRGEIDSPVMLELTPTKDTTRLMLSQETEERAECESSLSDFWMLSFENLRRLVIQGSGPIFCDYTAHRPGEVVVTTDIAGPPEAVFEALIDPAQLNRYIADKAVVEPHVGGKYDFGWSGTHRETRR